MLFKSTELARQRRTKATQQTEKDGRPNCALVVSKGMSLSQAQAFARAHFNQQVQIFLADVYAPINLVLLGMHTPRIDWPTNIKPREIFLPLGVGWHNFELINIITLFPAAQKNGGEKPRNIISILGFTPDELPKLLKRGLKAFPA
jgi:hypothetical protein